MWVRARGADMHVLPPLLLVLLFRDGQGLWWWWGGGGGAFTIVLKVGKQSSNCQRVLDTLD